MPAKKSDYSGLTPNFIFTAEDMRQLKLGPQNPSGVSVNLGGKLMKMGPRIPLSIWIDGASKVRIIGLNQFADLFY